MNKPSSSTKRRKAQVQKPLAPRRPGHTNKTVLTRNPDTKQARCIDLLRRSSGATVEDLQEATDWQAHSVRGFLTAVVKNRLGLNLVSAKSADGTRRYRIGGGR